MTAKPKVIRTYEGILSSWDPPLSYRVEKKAIRHVYFRIKEGTLVVSAPRYVTHPQALQLMEAHRTAINKLLQRTKAIPPVALETQTEWSILGRVYSLHPGTPFHMEETAIYYPASWRTERLQRAVALHVLPPVIDSCVDDYWPHIDYHCESPQYRFKTMKRLYGVYYKHNHTITYNTYLIHLSVEVVRYVVLHELMHAIHLNHSAQFYQAIAQLMPDYRRIHDQLKQSGIAHFDSKRG